MIRIITTTLSIFSLMAYVLNVSAASPTRPAENFIGAEACKGCHLKEYQQWQNSDHDWAMREASEQSVLGNFNNQVFEHFGSKSRFYRKNNEFWVETENAEGAQQNFKISYTFGFFPLQQYLIGFPDGRYQALNIAWDSRPNAEGGQRWYHLYPNEAIPHNDVLHWTGPYFNWNSRCAACHSTNLERNYNATNNTYNTRWSEINVSCEACHGPGKKHLQLIKEGATKKYPHSGFDLYLSPVGAWLKTQENPTLVHTGERDDSQVDVCGSCHGRRAQISEALPYGAPATEFHNAFDLSLLEEPLYYPDGQIRDEVFEIGSFVQSKMFHKGVTCSNCHEPHSLKLRAPGNQVCAQCHAPDYFDTPKHHHHTSKSEGAQCVNCHMPSTNYMVVDGRRDHSIRIPRPDLSDALGAPNACVNCHQNKTNPWAATALQGWLAQQDKSLPAHYGQTIHAAQQRQASAEPALIKLINSPTSAAAPALVQATALTLLPPTAASLASAQQKLTAKEPLIRKAAVSFFAALPAAQRLDYLLPLAKDKAKVVRLEVARLLAEINSQNLNKDVQAQLGKLFAEYIQAQQVNADTPEAQMNLGIFYTRQQNLTAAKTAYELAIKLSPQFANAYLNLADLYRMQGLEAAAQKSLQTGIAINPTNAALHYALGLSLIRQKNYIAAEKALHRATELDSTNLTYLQAHALTLEQLGRRPDAINLLINAPEQRRDNLSLLVTYLKKENRLEEAQLYTKKLHLIQE
ncbi:tetratricopeptide repeat protein [Cellvibrio sp. OA-2007]|uniref:tetratricopeptide repeat protein n=1 Tax=Cellvibrio sp. OA-2007 TaxID=529823 RepID=UPI0007835370|nr:tetratricopeptide repeat protein [Cellvibrio sp. OA-2007]